MALNGSRPLIGISTYLERMRFGVWDADAAVLHRDYLDAVVRAGGQPVLLPPVGEWTDLSFVDGLVLAGGADVDPARYGAVRDPRTGPAAVERDAAEFALVARALAADLPLLAVCRGMQILNVALGGTLVQHVDGHNVTPAVFEKVDVAVSAGRLAGIVGPTVSVMCHHHQALDVLGEGLSVVGRAPDGVVEAVELPDRRFVVGVQSHPEADREDRVFGAFVEAARKGGGE
ncbi:gamma-glutamyl-gamma-aminobutyrate hydrolase family protein [Actinosynnema sp. CA-248983]